MSLEKRQPCGRFTCTSHQLETAQVCTFLGATEVFKSDIRRKVVTEGLVFSVLTESILLLWLGPRAEPADAGAGGLGVGLDLLPLLFLLHQ